MKKTFKANNITCSGCANLITNSLEDDFGKININLEADPKEVSLEIKNTEQEDAFKLAMSNIGFDIIEN